MSIVKYQHIYNPAKGGEISKEEWEAFKAKYPTWKLYWKVIGEVESTPDKNIVIPEEAVKAEAKKNKKNDTDTSVDL